MSSSPLEQTNSAIADALKEARQKYQYNYNYIPPLPLVDQLPDGEDFSREWYGLLVNELRQLFLNTLITNRGNQGNEKLRDDVRKFIFEVLRQEAIPTQVRLVANILQIAPQFLLQGISTDFHELDDLLLSLLRQSGLSIFGGIFQRAATLLEKGHPTGHVSSLEDYHKLFPVIEKPTIANIFDNDEVFAYLRVAGYNPVMIQRISSLDSRFPLTDAQYQEIMGNEDSLALAGSEGRLYLLDYQILEGAINGTFPKDQKYLFAPLALFAVPKGSDPNRKLQVVAIQCGQTPGNDNPIFTPKSAKYAWLFAKTVVEVADSNFHEAVSHLARTHLFVQPFVMVTHRQLLDSHHVSLLLRPHFEGTLAINNGAQAMLIAPKGGVDQLLAATIDNSRVLAVKGVETYGFNSAMLPNQLKLRGVDDPKLLPVYPYRDDALLIWQAIHQWVSDYISLYYSNDEAVQKDTQLQNWAREAQADDGGRVPDFGENGGIQTKAYLIDALTLIIFTASAQHAAVNFPQKGIMSYAPAVPLAGYLPNSILKQEITAQDYLNLLPPLEQAQTQLNLLTLLGSIYYNKLGQYEQGYFSDPRVKPLLEKFQAKLEEIEDIIKERNFNRPEYNYLLPSKIPQSINI